MSPKGEFRQNLEEELQLGPTLLGQAKVLTRTSHLEVQDPNQTHHPPILALPMPPHPRQACLE